MWREPDGLWRWRYRDPSVQVDLVSGEVYDSGREAVRAATGAYPGTPVRIEEPRAPRASRTVAGTFARWFVRTAAALAAFGAVRRMMRVTGRALRWRRRIRGAGGGRRRI